MPSTADSSSRWRLTTARAVLIVLVLAAAVRIFAALTLPLIIGNDGVGYLLWGEQIALGNAIDWPSYRTPGYSYFLAGLFWLFGVGPTVVIVAQQVLGIFCAVIVAWAASRLFRPRNGLICGSLVALDPVFLALPSHAMTEMLASFLLLSAAGIILIRPVGRDRLFMVRAALLGVVLAALCLVRPAFQVVVPFMALAVLLPLHASPRPTRRFAFGAVAVGAAFLAVSGQWLHHNWQRGIRGYSSSSAVFIWIGMSNAYLLDLEYPLPEEVRRDYVQRVKPWHYSQGATHTFLNKLGVWHAKEPAEMLTKWAVHSILNDPGAYIATLPRALGWQLDYTMIENEMAWMLKRVAEDGAVAGYAEANFNFDGDQRVMHKFATPAGWGPVGEWVHLWGRWNGTPTVRIPFFLITLIATVMAVHRRRWDLALVLAGTLVYVALHTAFLLFNSRFSAPCWMVWYLSPAILAAAWRPSPRILKVKEVAAVSA